MFGWRMQKQSLLVILTIKEKYREKNSTATEVNRKTFLVIYDWEVRSCMWNEKQESISKTFQRKTWKIIIWDYCLDKEHDRKEHEMSWKWLSSYKILTSIGRSGKERWSEKNDKFGSVAIEFNNKVFE